MLPPLRSPFVLRDVIHGYIDFTDDQLGRMARAVLHSRPFQRLRRLHQLGLGSLIFPNAEHSRFSHSLGAYQLCRRAMAELDRKNLVGDLTDRDRWAVGLAAMLHDIGHGIFSHSAEKIWDFRHEVLTDRLIREDEELAEIWERYAPPGREFAEHIVSIRNGTRLEADRYFLHDLVSSQLDVDRMDYLQRDAYMAGVRYGGFDLDWILRHLAIGNWRDKRRLAIEEKADDALTQYLVARFHMYKKVYEHPTVRIYDAMLHGLVVRVRTLDPSALCKIGVEWLLEPLGVELAKFLERDDSAMVEALKRIEGARLSDPITCRLAGDLLADRRWEGVLSEGEISDGVSWDGEVFSAPYVRGRFYDLGIEEEVLVVGAAGVRALSDDPRVLSLSYEEPEASIRIRPPEPLCLSIAT